MKKLKELDKTILDGLIQKAAIIYRVNLDTINLTIISQTLLTEFGNMSAVDFEAAFVKHAAGNFSISRNPDSNRPFGDLSAYFVCSVLKYFKEWNAKETLKQKSIAAANVPAIEYKPDEGKEAFELIKEFAGSGKKILFANWRAAFKYMECEGIIKKTNEEKQLFLDAVIKELKEELTRTKWRSNEEKTIKEILNNKGLLKLECRKRFIKQHFNLKE